MSVEFTVAKRLMETGQSLATAESCTGGLIGHRITNLEGSSKYYLGGVVSYSNRAKIDLLGVSRESLKTHGAVSDVVAREMAEGARSKMGADVVIAVTGIAGPGGGTAEKPVGTVFMGLATAEGTETFENHFSGDRESVKRQTAERALELVARCLA